MTIEVTRTDLSARELRGAASKAKDAKAARSMLAIAQVLEVVDRTTATSPESSVNETTDWQFAVLTNKDAYFGAT